MKSFILAIGLLLILSSEYANAAHPPTSILSEVWFADNGHLMVEFSTMGLNSIPLNKIIVIHGEYRESFRDSTILIDSSAIVIDITERMPNMVFNPEGDTIIIGHLYGEDEEQYSWLDRLIWGNGHSVDINPPQPGQSMAHTVKWSENDYTHELWPYFKWVIDEPPTPGTHCFQPVARSLLKVKITDQNNDPVPYALLYYYSTSENSLTYENGEYIAPIFPGRFDLVITHPIYAEWVLNKIYVVEPFDTLLIPLQIIMPENYPYDNLKKLRAFPTPLNVKKDYAVTFRYFGEIKDYSYIKVYDIKGRFIGKVTWGSKGFAHWIPQPDDASGFYIARLISGNKVLDTIKFSIIN